MLLPDLVKKISHHFVSFTEQEVKKIVQTIFDRIKTQLKAGGRIEIRGFGSFDVLTRPPRLARNPKTGESFTTKPKKVVRFKPSKILKEHVDASKALPIKKLAKKEKEKKK